MESNLSAWMASVAIFISVFCLTAFTVRNWVMHSPMRVWLALFCVGYIAVCFLAPPPALRAVLNGTTFSALDAIRQVFFSMWFALTMWDSQLRMTRRRKTDPEWKGERSW